MSKRLTLHDVNIQNGSIQYEYERSLSCVELYHSGPYTIEYNTPIEDVPLEIATIPFVANVLPAAWAHDVDVHVPCIDPTFKQSMSRIRGVLDSWYPSVGFSGGHTLVENGPSNNPEEARDQHNSEKVASLFSAGVDSVTTYLRHSEKQPHLMHIHFWSERENRSQKNWAKYHEELRTFAESEDVPLSIINAKPTEHFDNTNLTAYHKNRLNGTWWQMVQHIISLTGTLAPLLYHKNIGNLYIPSSHTEKYHKDNHWGSHPAIDNKIGWRGTSCIHDGFEMTRQQKWQQISEYYKEIDFKLTIRSCEPNPCGRCFDCARNMAAMIISDVDLESQDYDFSAEQLDHIKDNIESGQWAMDDNNLFFWEDIQNHTPAEFDSHDLTSKQVEFHQWLKTIDLHELNRSTITEEDSQRKLYEKVFRFSPLLATFIKRSRIGERVKN